MKITRIDNNTLKLESKTRGNPEMKRAVDKLKRRGFEIKNTGCSALKLVYLTNEQAKHLKEKIGTSWTRNY